MRGEQASLPGVLKIQTGDFVYLYQCRYAFANAGTDAASPGVDACMQGHAVGSGCRRVRMGLIDTGLPHA